MDYIKVKVGWLKKTMFTRGCLKKEKRMDMVKNFTPKQASEWLVVLKTEFFKK